MHLNTCFLNRKNKSVFMFILQSEWGSSAEAYRGPYQTSMWESFCVNQKQPIENFYNEKLFSKFLKIYRKTLVPQPFFNKVTDLSLATLLWKRIWHRCFPVNFTNFKNTFITEHPQATDSGKIVKVACMVDLKLFFMDWFYYNLVILIK